MVLKPQWVTITSQRGNSMCGGMEKRSSGGRFGGCGPEYGRILVGAYGNDQIGISLFRSSSMMAARTPGVRLKTVPRLAWTVGRSGRLANHGRGNASAPD